MPSRPPRPDPAPDSGPGPAPATGPGGAVRPAKEPSFEERLASLEQVVSDLEGEGLSLEASIARYREGVEHLKACRAMLDDAEQRLVELVQEGGTDEAGRPRVSERPLKVTERGLEPDDLPGA